MENSSDDSCRFDYQCLCTCPRQTWFKDPGCSGVYSVDDLLSLVLIITTFRQWIYGGETRGAFDQSSLT